MGVMKTNKGFFSGPETINHKQRSLSQFNKEKFEQNESEVKM